ncbi:ATP-binding cassette sub-family A member 3 [Culex quinquefasciatus]|uniref:ATP-binding cassette sub-family A member 3 n=1 Tax=Culex quinquefasciatus TaxID=7176 RepID=UPI0018E29FFE|nr:ATP-binding cassette sub-family A member 3 [Culex quinquefasciatus]XP_038108177.1 ATP-binding cassette sub-family A member 3 [Culex quinquefasciatus]
MGATSWDKFLLLLWKNWTIQKRHYVQTAFEIFIPAIACAVLILIRGLVDPVRFSEPTVWSSLPTDTIEHILPEANPTIDPPINFMLAYSPGGPLLDRLVSNAALQIREPLEVQAFDNATQLENFLRINNTLVGIEFPDHYRTLDLLPEDVTFSLRFPSEMRTFQDDFSAFWANWFTELMFPQFQIAGAVDRERADGGYPANYYNESFIAVQSALSRAIILERDPTAEFPPVFLQRFPYPPYYSDPLLTGLENLLPLIIVIAFFYSAINTVKYITVEKERQLKETMKIMGLSSWLHWAAWFVKCILLLAISISLITVLLCVDLTTNSDLAIFEYADWTVVWVYLFVFSVATVCFCFMMSTIFSKANLAAGISGLIWFIMIVPYNIVFASYDTLSLAAKLAMCIFSNSSLSFGLMLMMRHEGTSNGLQWENLFEPVTVDDNLSVGQTMLMLLLDGFLYLLIALYIEKVFPGEFGVGEPWYFLFTKKFWSGSANKAKVDYAEVEENENLESEPVGKGAGIKIRKLRKEFGKNKVAVDGLSLNMFEDQITVLLGHNGAGKTTTMSMLTGLFAPTSGTAIINGYDITTDMEAVRGSLGLCPQHNVLFDELTVSEHIEFFARLKGVTGKGVKAEIEHFVKILELEDKIHKESRTLSGGMKRKLSVGIALCGGSKVVLCDEPTSGMDPSARRALWDLLIREKKGRTILLSTHFMDEADILGDRIAIMADGELKAAGSSFFLKKRFGVGYRLICVKDDSCNPRSLETFLKQYIPDIEIDTDIGTELSFVLSETYTSVFQTMLKSLEDNTETLGIRNYGISLTTLEEVFLRVGSDSHALDKKPENNGELNGQSNGTCTPTSIKLHEDQEALLKGSRLVLNQIGSMFLKKIISTKRSWAQQIVQILIPIYFVVVTVAIVRSIPGLKELPPLRISISNYSLTTTLLEAAAPESDIISGYRTIFDGLDDRHRLKVIYTDMEEELLYLSTVNIGRINREFMIGATVTDTNQTVWFNPLGFHTAPLGINYLYNAMLKSLCPSCRINVINKPIPFRPNTRFIQLQSGNNLGFQLSFNSGFAMSFVAALYIMFYIKERTSRAKLLQFVSGVNVFTFWAVNFVWDYFTYLITALVYLGILSVWQEEGWSTVEELSRVFLILCVFGLSFLPITYIFSFWFDVPSTGFVKMMLINLFSGTILFVAVFLLQFEAFNLMDISRILEWFFMIFPLFSFSQSLSNLNVLAATKAVCRTQCEVIPFCTEQFMCSLFPNCCDTQVFTWDPKGVNRQMTYMAVVGIVAFVVLIAVEFRLFDRIINKGYSLKNQRPAQSEEGIVDADVLKEKQRVASMTGTQIAEKNLVMRDFTKYYKSFLAVNQLSVAVDPAECFGLLGVNGAGKTSTFKMLTGDENISFGEAWVKGIDLKTNMSKVNKNIGYCPQFDAVLEDLTGRETLKIFALMRGIAYQDIKSTSEKLAQELNFTKHIDKRIKEYSGGNKRKLSTALALLANPAVIYLDEPTTGMDPGAKRHLWNVILNVKKSGKSIILTSHSMEECEALCTRLAIMVNGEFKCLGSTQHLKNQFSKGYFLTVKIRKAESVQEDNRRQAEVKTYVADHFEGASLREEHQDSLAYHIPQSDLKWSTMFGIMETAKRTLDIEDYALGQTSLEQVFLFFTKYQRITDDSK